VALEKREKVWGHVFRAEELRLQKRFDEAEPLYGEVLREDPTHELALLGMAKVWRHHYKDWSRAIHELDKAIQARPDCARALYNRACYKNLMLFQKATRESRKLRRSEKEQVFRDLREALRLHPSYRAFARKDRDFENLFLDPEFVAALSQG
jgi:tetratricopeptide (TPR) repeat protein